MPLLDLSPAAHRVLKGLRAAGGRPLIVGGAVRDAFLVPDARTPKDIDVEVYGIATIDDLVTALAGTGRVKRQGVSFEIVAVTVGGETFDVSLPRAGVGDPERAAFAQRDFTMNALGYDPNTDEVIDHWGGLADLRAGILRHTGPSFADDPLRVLRGVQLAGRFNLTMADETVALARELVDRYDELPSARVWGEWHKLASLASYWPGALDTLRRTGWDRHFPELAATQGVAQDPGWHSEGDVWTHLGLAAQAAAEAIAADPMVSERSRDVIVLGALAHDFGKVTHSQVRDGRITSYGHAAAGVGPTESFLTRIGAPRHLIDSILPIVREHMAHVGIQQNRPTAATVRRLIRRLNPDGRGATLAEWAAVVDADCAGRGASSKPSPSPAWLAVADRIGPAPAKRLLDGSVLIAHGITPGPTFRRILAASVQAQDDGAFDTAQGAASWFAASEWAQADTSDSSEESPGTSPCTQA